MNYFNFYSRRIGLLAVILGSLTIECHSSSHREAPSITETPKVDATDFYLFNSYEEGRDDYVTIIANYLPLQDAYGGPNYFSLDENAIYEIHLSNDGGNTEDITFQFDFTNTYRPTRIPVGDAMVEVPLLAIGPVTAGDSSSLLLEQSYTITHIVGSRTTMLMLNSMYMNWLFPALICPPGFSWGNGKILLW